jgi:hypothetical protein
MTTILVVRTLALANALRNNQADPHADAIRAELQKHGATVRPFNNQISGVDPHALYFFVQVDSSKRVALLGMLRQLHGVNAAYTKPADSPA